MKDTAEHWPLPDGYSLDFVWENKAEALLREIVEFWLANNALNARDVAEKRAPQVVATLRDVGGALIGVSTVYQQVHPRFGVSFHYYRSFIAEAHRKVDLGSVMLIEVSRYLARRFKEGHDQGVVGVFVELQNEGVQRSRNQAVWPFVPFVFAGKTPGGAHERVYYFEGARI